MIEKAKQDPVPLRATFEVEYPTDDHLIKFTAKDKLAISE